MGPGVHVVRMGLQTVVSAEDEDALAEALEGLVAAGAVVTGAPRLSGPQWIAVCEGVPAAGAYAW